MRVLLCLCLLAGIARADDDTRVVTGYRNGKPMKVRVTTIGWADVELGTARAFLAMQEAAGANGITLQIWSGFRSHDRQAQLYAAWKAGYGNRAAKPGFSNHETGLALDLVVRDEETLGWLEAHAQRFGFKRTVAGEPWHWEHVLRRSTKPTTARVRRIDRGRHPDTHRTVGKIPARRSK